VKLSALATATIKVALQGPAAKGTLATSDSDSDSGKAGLPADISGPDQSMSANVTDKISGWMKAKVKEKLKEAAATALSKEQIQALTTQMVEQLTQKINIHATTALMAVGFDEGMASAAIGTAARVTTGQVARQIASRSLGVAGFLVGAVSDSMSTGCDEDHQLSMNLNKENGCKPVLEVNKNVLNFVNSSPQDQARDLSNPKVCKYYKDLRDKLYHQPKFKSLECQGNHVKLVTQSDDGASRTDDILLNSSKDGLTPSIKQINVRGGGSWTGVLQMNSDGSVQGFPNSDIIASEVRPLRLYVNDAIQCCSTTDEAAHSACMSNYNSGGNSNSTSRSPASVNLQSTK
jgi:hypothetical protein